MLETEKYRLRILKLKTITIWKERLGIWTPKKKLIFNLVFFWEGGGVKARFEHFLHQKNTPTNYACLYLSLEKNDEVAKCWLKLD